MKQTLHLSMNTSGCLIPKILDSDEVQLVLVALVAAGPDLKEMVERPFKTLVADLLARAEGLLEELRAFTKAQEQPPVVTTPTPAPSEALLALADAETLSNTRAVNSLIDNLMGSLEGVVVAVARKRAVNARVRAARALGAHMFPDGRKFLTESHKRQWLAVNQRVTDLDDSTWEAIDLLGLREDIEAITLLNAHFGALLGLTQATTSSTSGASLKDLMTRFQGLLTQYLGLANALWPLPSQDEARAAFLNPYLPVEIDRAQDRAARQAPKPQPTSPQPTPAPTSN